MTTEKEIEEELIEKLQGLNYTYRPDIRNRSDLESNFRQKFNELNGITLTDHEYERLLDAIITADVFAASKTLREQGNMERDDGTHLFYNLVNTADWCKNTFEVVNQLKMNTHSSYHKYDVMLLMNGIPVAQIELKAHQVNPRRAMQQIVEYKNTKGNGYQNTLLCFIQLFIVSNKFKTWYFANNNSKHFSFNADERYLPIYRYAHRDNTKIERLDHFATEFLAKCTLAEMISRYMVLVETEQKLLMMRPYQIYAVKAIVDCIKQNCGNGYIWHTTGSGKTLTSFKASTLLQANSDIAKCVFVVDRKDLDKQTRDEFNRFQKGCVEENTNTESLVKRLVSEDLKDKVIVTTIQKLGLALDATNRNQYRQRLATLSNERVVFIFDECHRSQFGENHKAISEFFPKAQLFGFTGTPIFEENSNYTRVQGEKASYITTESVFQRLLHSYTITHAIEDENVLRFHIDYFTPPEEYVQSSGDAPPKQAVVNTILSKHDKATGNRKFNAFFATNSINDAIEYYNRFKAAQEKRKTEEEEYVPLNITCIFSPPSSGDRDVRQLQEDLPQELADNKVDPEAKKAALIDIIEDYNAMYGTNCRITEFDKYYQDVQERVKDQKSPNSEVKHSKKIDIVIVVDMMLTGFDSSYLNTLYVDKRLRYHGLIQAFSRTNRILNASKPYGNIIDFRRQEDAVETAITRFSGKTKKAPLEIWLVEPAPVVIEEYRKAVSDLDAFMKEQGLETHPSDVSNIKGDTARAEFVNRFKEVQKLKTKLDQYTDITEEQAAEIEEILPQDEARGFKVAYLETAQRLKLEQETFGEEVSEEVDQLDFEFVLFSSAIVDYDYIMSLITRFSNQTPSRQKMSRDQLVGLIESDSKFLDEREDIVDYIDSLTVGSKLSEEDVRTGYEEFKREKKDRVISEMASNHGLDAEGLKSLVDDTLRKMVLDGESIRTLLEPLDLGWRDRAEKERELMKDLVPLFNKYAENHEIAGLAVYEN